MKTFTKLSIGTLFLIISICSFGQGETYVTTWQNNARGATVFTLDDFTWSHYLNGNFYNEVAPVVLHRHGLVGTFGIVLSRFNYDTQVRGLKFNMGMGHSVASHGRWHLDMRIERPSDTLYEEIVTPKIWFDSAFAGMQTMDIFMFPYCSGLEESMNLSHSTFYGVRDHCWGSADCRTISETDHFSSFNTTNASTSEPEVWKATIDSAIAKKGFTLTLSHDLNTTGQTEGLNEACGYIRQKVNEGLIWNATFRDMMKYGKEREFSDVTVVSNTSSLIEISITDTFPDDLFNVPLTLVTKVPSDWAYAEVSQGGELIGVIEVQGDTVMYNVVPDQGLVQLMKATESYSVIDVDIIRDTVWVLAGDVWQLHNKVFPLEASNKNLTWSSANSSVVSVDEYGRLTAVAEGETTITVTTEDGGFTDQVVAIVYDALAVNESSVSIPSSITIDIGETYKLFATVLPESADNKNCVWVTEDYGVATVDQNGRVTGHSEGTTVLLVGTIEQGRYATCTVTVTSSTAVPVTGITVNPTILDLNTGQTSQIIATVSPANASNKEVTWSSNNTSVATVNSSGQVSAVGDGTATITATTIDGDFTATTTVNVTTVIIPATGVSVSPDSWTLTLGASVQLTAVFEPENTTNRIVTWSSDDESVAIVNSSGIVTSLAEGTANITVTTDDGGFTASCEIEVLASGTTFRYLRFTTFGAGNLSLREADWMMGATEYPLVNMTSNTQGVLTAFSGSQSYYLYDGTGQHIYVGATSPFINGIDLGAGNDILPTDLKIWAYPWGRADSISIEGSNDYSNWVFIHGEADPFNGDTLLTFHFDTTVTIPVTGVSVSPATLSLQPTENSTLTASIEPADASNQLVNWSSDNTGVATVDAFGMVTAVTDGTATITATTVDGSYTDICDVTVATIVTKYALTVNNGTGDGDYEEGEIVNITADPPPVGQEFVSWTGDTQYLQSTTSDTTTLTMPAADVSITATYQNIVVPTYTLTVNSGLGDGDYLEDEVVNITADAAPGGQEFDVWTGDVSNVADVNSASTTIAMPATNITINATYRDIVPDTYTLIVNSGTGDGDYEEGEIVNVIADTPPIGQEFDLWTGDTQYLQSATATATTLTMPAQAAVVTATYKDIDPGNGINDSNIEISLYPNPADNYVTIVNVGLFNELQIINSLGQVIRTNSICNNEFTLDISDLDSGIYFIKMKNDIEQDIHKLLIR